MLTSDAKKVGSGGIKLKVGKEIKRGTCDKNGESGIHGNSVRYATIGSTVVLKT